MVLVVADAVAASLPAALQAYAVDVAGTAGAAARPMETQRAVL